MAAWSQRDLHKHMQVYTSDNTHIGHIKEIYEDSIAIHQGNFLHKDRYIPYGLIAQVDNDTVHITLNANDVQEKEWEKRPDYEDHLGDPTQLMYDRGHGASDPFEDTTPEKP